MLHGKQETSFVIAISRISWTPLFNFRTFSNIHLHHRLPYRKKPCHVYSRRPANVLSKTCARSRGNLVNVKRSLSLPLRHTRSHVQRRQSSSTSSLSSYSSCPHAKSAASHSFTHSLTHSLTYVVMDSLTRYLAVAERTRNRRVVLRYGAKQGGGALSV